MIEILAGRVLGGRFRNSVRAYATGSFKRDGVDRLSDNVRASWGTYYDQHPQVTAVHVATAFATLTGKQ